MDGATKDHEEAAFNDAYVALMSRANEDRVSWAIEYLWHFHRDSVVKWFNGLFFKCNTRNP